MGDGQMDVAFDAVGVPATFRQAVRSVRRGGIVVAIGGWRAVELGLDLLVREEIELRGSFNYTIAEFEEACLWLAEERFEPDLLVTDLRPMRDGAEAFAELARRRGVSIKVVLTSEA